MATAGDLDYNRALDALEAGDLNGALVAVESALMFDSKDGGYWQLYSVLLAQAGRSDDAAKAKVKAEEFGLDEVDSLLMKAAEAAASQSWNKAVTACEKALEMAPERGEVWASYAANLMEGGYQKDALEASEKAATLVADEPQVWYLRGRVLRLNEKLEEAVPAYLKAVELDSGFALAWYEKGMVHHQMEDFEAAKECFLKAKELKLDDPGVEEALRIVSESKKEK
ncbi:MAG: tetratricopeptide repeat protein [Roseibacillus sp.]